MGNRTKNQGVAVEAEAITAWLCDRSDVTLASLRRFERTGLIAFDLLLRLATALGRLTILKPLWNGFGLRGNNP